MQLSPYKAQFGKKKNFWIFTQLPAGKVDRKKKKKKKKKILKG